MEASAGRTTETKDRADILVPPNTVVMIEGCSPEAVATAASRVLAELAPPEGSMPAIGTYRLEHTRLKTGHAPG
jgi:ribosomal protein L6P/L9E